MTDCDLWAFLMTKATPIPESGCWIWDRGTTVKGYGQMHLNGKRKYAHRHAYELANGPIPNGLGICHKCDVPACINPSHLFAGTHQENMTDRDRKGRLAIRYGEKNSAAKLTADKVRALRASGLRDHEAAKVFGISRRHANDIRRGLVWRNI